MRETDRLRPRLGYSPETRAASTRGLDLDRWTWQRKLRRWRDLDVTVVAPSRWMADEARASVLFRHARIRTIHNGIDLDLFKPVDRAAARRAFNLPRHQRLIVLGSVGATSDPRKGFNRLEPAIRRLAQSSVGRNAELVVFGADAPVRAPSLGMEAHFVGRLQDDVSIAALYAAADLFVAPSTQDNLPNTVLEAMACGTPCVAFDVGGLPDLIEDRRTGYLARPFETEDLAHGIGWVLHDEDRRPALSVRSREKARGSFSIQAKARAMAALYEEVLGARPAAWQRLHAMRPGRSAAPVA